MKIKNFATSYGLFGNDGFIKSGSMEEMIEEAKEYTCKGIMNRVTLSTIKFDKGDNIYEGTIILTFTIVGEDLIIVNNLV